MKLSTEYSNLGTSHMVTSWILIVVVLTFGLIEWKKTMFERLDIPLTDSEDEMAYSQEGRRKRRASAKRRVDGESPKKTGRFFKFLDKEDSQDAVVLENVLSFAVSDYDAFIATEAKSDISSATTESPRPLESPRGI